MKRCPYCGADNSEDAAVCFNCGRPLPAGSRQPGDPGRTQPTQPMRRRASPMPPASPAYDPDATQPVPQPPPAYVPPPAYNPPPTYNAPSNTQPYPAGGYPPPPPSAYPNVPAQSGTGRAWRALALALGVLLLCICGLAIWTMSTAGNNGIAQIRGQVETQAANTFPGAAPTSPAVVAQPTAWPTFTPQPTDIASAPEATQAPAQGPTQAPLTDKLLSENCANALDTLSKTSGEATSDPLKLLDATWRDNFNKALADMKTYCGTLDEASPVPGQISEARHNLSLASQEYDKAKQTWQEGIDQKNPGKILEAGGHVQQALKYLNLGISQLQKLGR